MLCCLRTVSKWWNVVSFGLTITALCPGLMEKRHPTYYM